MESSSSSAILLAGEPFGDELQDLALAAGELAQGAVRVAASAREHLDHMMGDGGREVASVFAQGIDGLEQFARAVRLGDEARGPGSKRLAHLSPTMVRREDQDTCVRLRAVHAVRHLDPGELGKRELADHHVGLDAKRELQRLLAVAGLSYHVEIFAAFDQALHGFPEDRLVVRQQDAGFHVRPPSRSEARLPPMRLPSGLLLIGPAFRPTGVGSFIDSNTGRDSRCVFVHSNSRAGRDRAALPPA